MGYKTKPWFRITAAFLLLWSILHLVYYNTAESFRQISVKQLVDATLNRIALDIPELKLADNRFDQATNSAKVARYMNSLNDYLQNSEFPIRVKAIQGTELSLKFEQDTQVSKKLLFPRETISVQFAVSRDDINYSLYWLPFTISLLLTYLAIPHLFPKSFASNQPLEDEQDIPVKLILDLTSRTLYLNTTPDLKVPMANKPFCFYLAMLEYCSTDKDPALYHNKELPDEFLALSDKYFMRLMDLGHTKRKRPDFSANIDKMLSEIRNALDEVLANESEIKGKFFPKKAQGEGSRSKLNNFALSGLHENDYELLGK